MKWAIARFACLVFMFIIDPKMMFTLFVAVFLLLFSWEWVIYRLREWLDAEYARCLQRIRALERWHETHP